MPKIKLIVDGGEMKTSPAVAQQLGPMGINLGKVTSEVNAVTSGFKGMKVPVELDVNATTKEFTIQVFSPPVAELLKSELKVEKGSGAAGKNKIGNLAIEQVIGIAKTKLPNMLARDLKAAVKLVAGSCVSLGILIESRNPVEVIADINSGKYDFEIGSEKTDVSAEKKAELSNYFKRIQSQQEAEAKAAEAAKAQAEAKPAEGEAKKEEKAPEKKA